MNKKTIAIIVLIVIIIVFALVVHFAGAPKTELSALKYAVPVESDYSLGASTSKIMIVEFADFACPYCRNSYTTIREIGFKYKDSVKIIFKDFPLHDNSLDLALAARCSGEQGLFWPMHDKLFALQSQFATSSLSDLAVSIGANSASFDQCLKSKKYLNDIKRDYLDGQALGVAGTPTFFINGYKIVGEIPMDKFEQIIEQFLK
jgi:protein-disulfide isomerase